MIENIIKDCIAFLALAFVVLFGFALALRVLFRGVQPESYTREDYRQFGTFQESLLTLFYALLGTFDPEVAKPVR